MNNFLCCQNSAGLNGHVNGPTANVLLLGVSYPDVNIYWKKHGSLKDTLDLEQVTELVQRGIVTPKDGRDLARCFATETIGGHSTIHAYTVSKDEGGLYRDDRHVYANFNNSRRLFKALTKNFVGIKFQQVILDYYWMPTVSQSKLVCIVCSCVVRIMNMTVLFRFLFFNCQGMVGYKLGKDSIRMYTSRFRPKQIIESANPTQHHCIGRGGYIFTILCTCL